MESEEDDDGILWVDSKAPDSAANVNSNVGSARPWKWSSTNNINKYFYNPYQIQYININKNNEK
jgi:hypothetical protein